MGAYDNPRIIQPPDYTEIFMKNFAAGQAVFDKAFEGVRKKKKERETKLDKAYQDTSTIRVKGNAINAGDMTANVRKQTNSIADDFYANELAYIDEKIDRQTYQTNKDKHLSKLQGMADIGGELSKIDLDNIKVSRHQKDKGRTLGLIEAYNNQAVDIDYSGDMPKLYYMDPRSNRVEINLGVLKNIKPEDFGINEVFELNEKTVEGYVKQYIKQSMGSSTVTLADGISKIKIDTYEGDQVFKSVEEADAANKQYEKNAVNAINSQLTNLYNNLDPEDKGSLFADKSFVSFTEGKNKENKFQEGKEDEINEILQGIEGMTDETIEHVKQQLLNGTYNGTDEQLNAMDQVSKTMLANQLFYNDPNIKRPKLHASSASAKQIEKAQKAEKLQDLSIERAEKALQKEQNKPNKPIVDYTELNYGDVTTNSKANNIREFLISYDDLQLSQAKTPQALITILKNLDKNDLGIQRGDNPYKNYLTVKEIKDKLRDNPEQFTNTYNKVKNGKVTFSETGDITGGFVQPEFYKKLNSLPEDSYVNLGTVSVKGEPYYYVGSYWNEADENSIRKSRFQDLSGDTAGQMSDILKGFDGFGVSKFGGVDPDVLISEIRLFIDNPRRFK